MLDIDKEFEKLGYTKFENNEVIEYRLNSDEGMTYILFDKKRKAIRSYEFYNDSGEIIMEELILIYAKCIEMVWLK